MCLIIFDWQPQRSRQLLLASNRDEFFDRPSAPAGFWHDNPCIYGGRDLSMGGTWLGVTTAGRLAAITNFRSPDSNSYQRSRGEITRSFLESDQSASEFARDLHENMDAYAGFNVLLCDGQELIYLSNREDAPLRALPPGQYGLSNHLLNTPWPKVEKARAALNEALLTETHADAEHLLFGTLADTQLAEDAALPDTGVGYALEKQLSAVFIQTPVYGTRTSTIVALNQGEHIQFSERNFAPGGKLLDQTSNFIEYA